MRDQLTTAEGQVKAQQTENETFEQKLSDAQAQVQTGETALADAQKQIADAQKELDEVKFAADRLLTQAEAALQKDNLGSPAFSGKPARTQPEYANESVRSCDS